MIPKCYAERAKLAFDYADSERRGALNKREYKIAMTAVFGYCPGKEEVKHVLRSTDKIPYDEFEYWVSKKCIAGNACISAEILFALLDKDCTQRGLKTCDINEVYLRAHTPCFVLDKGYLTLEDFRLSGEAVNLKVSSSVWQKVFRELDYQGKGFIDLDEFLSALSGI